MTRLLIALLVLLALIACETGKRCTAAADCPNGRCEPSIGVCVLGGTGGGIAGGGAAGGSSGGGTAGGATGGGTGAAGAGGGTSGSDGGNPTLSFQARTQCSGVFHSCAINASGVRCWGANAELAVDGDSGVNQFQAVAPGGVPPGAVSVGCGAFHSCAVLPDGRMLCWGRNDVDQIGSPETNSSVGPFLIPLAPIAGVAASRRTTCAVMDGGSVRCWGSSTDGEISTPMKTFRPDASVELVDRGVVALHAGRLHYCALMEDAGVLCWGENNDSQLGFDAGAPWAAPTRVSLPPARAVATGYQHTCALLASSEVWCWGRNDYGQTGAPIGAGEDVPVPTRTGLDGVVAIGAAEFNSCAVLDAGQVACWGRSWESLGPTPPPMSSPVPTLIPLPAAAVSVSPGNDFVCARLQNGEVWCWGSNAFGQLGSTGATSGTPRRVMGL